MLCQQPSSIFCQMKQQVFSLFFSAFTTKRLKDVCAHVCRVMMMMMRLDFFPTLFQTFGSTQEGVFNHLFSVVLQLHNSYCHTETFAVLKIKEKHSIRVSYIITGVSFSLFFFQINLPHVSQIPALPPLLLLKSPTCMSAVKLHFPSVWRFCPDLHTRYVIHLNVSCSFLV